MSKIKKEKTIMAISISCVSFILVMVMFTQFKTVEKTDISGIEIMRESELRTELASWKNKYEDALNKLDETENKIEEYTSEIENNNDLTTVLETEVQDAEMYAGYTYVQGEGIVITLKDTDYSQIVATDLIILVNELRGAGAEAISINGQRVVSTTDIADINYVKVIINTNALKGKVNRISSPYIIKAIGNQKYLESAISLKYGYIDSMEANEKDVSYTLNNNVVVESYQDDLNYNYATVVE